VLLFTPDVKEALEWFQLTYQLQGGYGWVEWQRTALPAAGGLEDQPAKLMETLALIARNKNALIEQARKQSRGAGRERDQEKRRG
jgi:hypothetical protein